MIKIGKGNDGNTLYLTEQELQEIAANLAEHKTKYSAQQWAKIRKILNRM